MIAQSFSFSVLRPSLETMLGLSVTLGLSLIRSCTWVDFVVVGLRGSFSFAEMACGRPVRPIRPVIQLRFANLFKDESGNDAARDDFGNPNDGNGGMFRFLVSVFPYSGEVDISTESEDEDDKESDEGNTRLNGTSSPNLRRSLSIF